MKTSFKYIFFIALFAFLGFTREFVFVNLNSRLYSLFYKHYDFHLPDSLFYFNQFDYSTLYFIKYPLTILYFLAYFFASYFTVKQLCDHKKIAQSIIYIYLLLLALASISMLYNYFINEKFDGGEYTFSRWLMGIAQSPLVAFFILASSKLYNKLQTEQ